MSEEDFSFLPREALLVERAEKYKLKRDNVSLFFMLIYMKRNICK